MGSKFAINDLEKAALISGIGSSLTHLTKHFQFPTPNRSWEVKRTLWYPKGMQPFWNVYNLEWEQKG